MGFFTDLLLSAGFETGILEPSNKPKDLDAMMKDCLSGKYSKSELRRRAYSGYYDKKD